jgi:hypothetical protein
VSAFSRPARLQNDPDKYIRPIKGGRYQARPYDLAFRYNLGNFHTKHAARKAIERFWKGEIQARLKFARPLPLTVDGVRGWIAVVRVPAARDRAAEREWRDHRRRALLDRGVPAEPPPGWRPPKLVSVRVPGTFATDVEAHKAAVAWLVREVGWLVAFQMAGGQDSPVFNPPKVAPTPPPPFPPPSSDRVRGNSHGPPVPGATPPPRATLRV